MAAIEPILSQGRQGRFSAAPVLLMVKSDF